MLEFSAKFTLITLWLCCQAEKEYLSDMIDCYRCKTDGIGDCSTDGSDQHDCEAEFEEEQQCASMTCTYPEGHPKRGQKYSKKDCMEIDKEGYPGIVRGGCANVTFEESFWELEGDRRLLTVQCYLCTCYSKPYCNAGVVPALEDVTKRPEAPTPKPAPKPTPKPAPKAEPVPAETTTTSSGRKVIAGVFPMIAYFLL